MLVGNEIIAHALSMNVILGTIFILSIALSTRRKNTGFKILPIGTGLLFFNSLYVWIGTPIFAELTYYFVLLGFIGIATAFFMMLTPDGGNQSHDK